MNEAENKNTNQTLVILGLIALIVVLFVGIKLIFAGLGAMLPKEEASRYTVLTDEKGQTSAYGAPPDGTAYAPPQYPARRRSPR